MSPIVWIAIGFVVLVVAAKVFAGRKSPEVLAGVKRALDAGARLVDVRTSAEFASGHLRGAINLPAGDLRKAGKKLGDKAKPVVVYCASGMRSSAAAQALRGSGFGEVHDLGAMANFDRLP